MSRYLKIKTDSGEMVIRESPSREIVVSMSYEIGDEKGIIGSGHIETCAFIDICLNDLNETSKYRITPIKDDKNLLNK